MSLKYTCPGCGTPLGYDGLCWKCKCEQERKTALAWTPEQIAAKQKNLIQNIHRLADMEDPECTCLLYTSTLLLLSKMPAIGNSIISVVESSPILLVFLAVFAIVVMYAVSIFLSIRVMKNKEM